MAFWIGIAVTAASLIISFVWTQKTFQIRLALLVLGLIGAGFTAYRYFADQKKAQQSLEYWEVARLNAEGFGLLGGSGTFLMVNGDFSKILQPYVHIDINSANFDGRWDCTQTALDAYSAAITSDDRFPFTYYYRATCRKAAGGSDWHLDIQKARCILLVTTRLPGHNSNHDALLKRINEGNLSTGN